MQPWYEESDVEVEREESVLSMNRRWKVSKKKFEQDGHTVHLPRGVSITIRMRTTYHPGRWYEADGNLKKKGVGGKSNVSDVAPSFPQNKAFEQWMF